MAQINEQQIKVQVEAFERSLRRLMDLTGLDDVDLLDVASDNECSKLADLLIAKAKEKRGG